MLILPARWNGSMSWPDTGLVVLGVHVGFGTGRGYPGDCRSMRFLQLQVPWMAGAFDWLTLSSLSLAFFLDIPVFIT